MSQKYDEMLGLAESFDRAAAELRARAGLGQEVLADPEVSDSAELSPKTWRAVEEDLSAASGRHGLLGRAIELDADALVVRATVLTYRWIDELAAAATETMGAIAGRAIGYLAPEVSLGGALVAAGLIETDALDREGVAAYLEELAAESPELMEHITSGGGLVESLRLRALLTRGMPSDPVLAAEGGLRAVGAPVFADSFGDALRDVAGQGPAVVSSCVAPAARPRGLAGLMETLASVTTSIAVHEASPGRYIAYLPGPSVAANGHLRLVSGDLSSYADEALAAISAAVEPGSRVMLVGSASGGATAASLAARPHENFDVEHVVTAGSPSAHVPRIPPTTRVLALEDRDDPVAVLGSLVNAGEPHRLTVVFDAASSDEARYVAGARAADAAAAPEVVGHLGHLRELGYLT